MPISSYSVLWQLSSIRNNKLSNGLVHEKLVFVSCCFLKYKFLSIFTLNLPKLPLSISNSNWPPVNSYFYLSESLLCEIVVKIFTANSTQIQFNSFYKNKWNSVLFFESFFLESDIKNYFLCESLNRAFDFFKHILAIWSHTCFQCFFICGIIIRFQDNSLILWQTLGLFNTTRRVR